MWDENRNVLKIGSQELMIMNLGRILNTNIWLWGTALGRAMHQQWARGFEALRTHADDQTSARCTNPKLNACYHRWLLAWEGQGIFLGTIVHVSSTESPVKVHDHDHCPDWTSRWIGQNTKDVYYLPTSCLLAMNMRQHWKVTVKKTFLVASIQWHTTKGNIVICCEKVTDKIMTSIAIDW